MPEVVPLGWAAAAVLVVTGLCLLICVVVCLLAGLALFLQGRNLERVLAMAISRKAAERYAVTDAQAKRPAAPTRDPARRIQDHRKEAEVEMRAAGLDPGNHTDRLQHMERAAQRA